VTMYQELNMKTIINHLHSFATVSNNKGLTKKHHTQCHALNMAFFVPKIQQACNLLKGYKFELGSKRTFIFLNMFESKAQNKTPLLGNMCSRVMRLSEARTPDDKSGELTKKHHGGQIMPLNTSKSTIIRTIQTVHTQNGIIATIHTCYNQKAVIGYVFASIKHLQSFIQSQGLSLDVLGGQHV